MPITRKETIDTLMHDLRQPGAFPTQTTTIDRKWLRRVRKAGVADRIEDLHDGMIIGKIDQALKKGVRPLLKWPTSGRGFF